MNKLNTTTARRSPITFSLGTLPTEVESYEFLSYMQISDAVNGAVRCRDDGRHFRVCIIIFISRCVRNPGATIHERGRHWGVSVRASRIQKMRLGSVPADLATLERWEPALHTLISRLVRIKVIAICFKSERLIQ
jgi:hypothetical protein